MANANHYLASDGYLAYSIKAPSLALLFVAVLMLPELGYSQLSINGDQEFGKDTITFDSQTQLEWLDVTLSQGRSYLDVVDETIAGGEFEGFRHATEAELLQFFEHAGIRNVNGDGPPFGPVSEIIEMVGVTWFACSYDCYAGTRAMLSDSVNSDQRLAAELGCVAGPGIGDCWVNTKLSYDESDPHGDVGHWLIRLKSSAIGDVNQDGIVDLQDVAPFIELVSAGNYQNEADVNWDGVVNLSDVEPFINLVTNN